MTAMTVKDVSFAMLHHPLWDIAYCCEDGGIRKIVASCDKKFIEDDSPSVPTVPNSVKVWNCVDRCWEYVPAGEKLLKMSPID